MLEISFLKSNFRMEWNSASLQRAVARNTGDRNVLQGSYWMGQEMLQINKIEVQKPNHTGTGRLLVICRRMGSLCVCVCVCVCFFKRKSGEGAEGEGESEPQAGSPPSTWALCRARSHIPEIMTSVEIRTLNWLSHLGAPRMGSL